MKKINLIPIILSIILAALIIITTTFLVIIPGHHANDCYGRGGFVDGYLSCTNGQFESDISSNNETYTFDNVIDLVSDDREIDLLRFFPNKMDGTGSGGSTWDDGYSLSHEWLNGTRTYEEFSNNGTLLKSIKIYDEPEKTILIMMK